MDMKTTNLYSVEGNPQITFNQLIGENTGDGIEPICLDDIKEIENLKIGESCFVGISEVKRIS